MEHDGMAMGSMSMGGVPALNEFPKFYWAVVGSAVGIGTLVNIFNHALYRQRLSAAKAGHTRPAKPKSAFFVTCATIFAIMREASNYSLRIPIKNRIFRFPTAGRFCLVLANIIVLLALAFYGFNLNDRWSREDIGYRTGFVSIAQIPLIFLLAGKNNIIGFFTGISHERLNWLHRWCARCLLLTTTIHMGYFFADWAPYDYIGEQLKTNNLVWRGVAAWAVLVWIVFSSMTPIRGWCYEIFVVQHLVSFAIFIAFVYIHTPEEVHVYIWIPVGVFFFDRGLRALRVLYTNISFFHPQQRKSGQMSGFWACRAEFTPLPHKTTRIVIDNPPINWKPGQHVFLSCHSVVPLQSHPFTVASIPQDGKMEFLVKAETGGTRRFFRHAEKAHGHPTNRPCIKTVAIEGPYGCLRPLRQFDSVVLLAGSTGTTFTVPLLRDVVQGWRENSESTKQNSFFSRRAAGAVTRHVRFVWVVKSRNQLSWFAAQLSAVAADVEALQTQIRDIKLEMSVYITCDDTFTEEHKTLLSTITAPNVDVPSKPLESRHGEVEELRSRPSSVNEKAGYEQREIQETKSPVSPKSTHTKGCGPDGTCCCKTTIDTEDPDAVQACCCCAKSASDTRPLSQVSSSNQSTSPKQKLLVHPSISILSGRPNPRNIIRRSLEQALGESAVVVCGPQGLVADVKQDVCALSDERAVHKGTGAQGIYLHTESFGY